MQQCESKVSVEEITQELAHCQTRMPAMNLQEPLKVFELGKQSLAKTASIPSWPLMPTPMHAPASKERGNLLPLNS